MGSSYYIDSQPLVLDTATHKSPYSPAAMLVPNDDAEMQNIHVDSCEIRDLAGATADHRLAPAWSKAT